MNSNKPCLWSRKQHSFLLYFTIDFKTHLEVIEHTQLSRFSLLTMSQVITMKMSCLPLHYHLLGSKRRRRRRKRRRRKRRKRRKREEGGGGGEGEGGGGRRGRRRRGRKRRRRRVMFLMVGLDRVPKRERERWPLLLQETYLSWKANNTRTRIHTNTDTKCMHNPF